MGRKKSETAPGVQVPLRVKDPRLIEVVDALAASERRSRNMMIVLLLEEALTARELWPVPPQEKEG